MAERNSRGGLLVIKSPTLNGAAIDIDFPAWADDVNYVEGNSVTIGTVAARCIEDHHSAASGLTDNSGVLGGDDADNWELVPAGNVAQLADTVNFSLGGETQQITKANLAADKTISSNRADTLTFDVWLDPDDKAQDALVMNARMSLDFYEQGRPTSTGEKRPKGSCTGVITGVDGAFNFTEPVRRTINFGVDGAITLTTETGA